MQIDKLYKQEITEELFKAYTKNFDKADSARLAQQRQTTTLQIPDFPTREKPTKLWFLAIPFTIIITLLIIYKLFTYVYLHKTKFNKPKRFTERLSWFRITITGWQLENQDYLWNISSLK